MIVACLLHVFLYLTKFGQAGKAILTGSKDEPVYPTKEDMVKDALGNPTLIQLYEIEDAVYDNAGIEISSFQFTGDSLKDFKRAVANFPTVVATYNVVNIPLSHFLLVDLGPNVARAV